MPGEPGDARGVDRQFVGEQFAAEHVDEHVGQAGAAAVTGQVVHADEVDELGLHAGLFADVADDGVDRAFRVADLASWQAPETVPLALLAEQHAAGRVEDDGADRRGERVHALAVRCSSRGGPMQNLHPARRRPLGDGWSRR